MPFWAELPHRERPSSIMLRRFINSLSHLADKRWRNSHSGPLIHDFSACTRDTGGSASPWKDEDQITGKE